MSTRAKGKDRRAAEPYTPLALAGTGIVLMDVSMPVMNGIEAARRIAAKAPAIGVLGLSMHADGNLVREMLQAGASGYVLKDRASKELVDAIRAVTAGGTYLSPAVAGILAEEHMGQTAADTCPPSAAAGRKTEVKASWKAENPRTERFET